MMLYNIVTGYGIERVPREEIVVFVVSLRHLAEREIDFVFTNQHALRAPARYFRDLADLDEVDWELLQRQDFQRNDEDPGKTDRYQAEALVWKHVPLDVLSGICCYDEVTQSGVQKAAEQADAQVRTAVRPLRYFV